MAKRKMWESTPEFKADPVLLVQAGSRSIAQTAKEPALKPELARAQDADSIDNL
ncbi:MAG: hypothetical protein ACOYNR_11980 [Blastocatellia bacterium]